MSMLNMLLGIGGSGTVSTLDIVDPFLDKSGIALYKMDGNAQDAGGLYNGTPTNVTYGTGKFGQCGVFNGRNTLINTGIPQSALTVSSFSVWVYPLSDSNNRGIFGDHNNYKGIIGFKYDNNVCQFGYGTGSAYVGAGITLVLNTWTHLVGIITGTGLQIYKNGLLEKSVAGGQLSANGNILIGRAYNYFNRYWSGSIDQFRIFNRALTAEEVAIIYTETKAA